MFPSFIYARIKYSSLGGMRVNGEMIENLIIGEQCMKREFVMNPETKSLNCGGVEVIVFSDHYPSGHQSGVTLVMHDRRMTNGGDVRYEQTPGQWQPTPVRVDRTFDEERSAVTAHMHYPDERAHLRGFNPIIYPDVNLDYHVEAVPCEDSVRISVTLDQPIPECLAGKASFIMELVPCHVVGKSWIMDEQTGIFPPQPVGPTLSLPANIDVAGIYPQGDGKADVSRLVGNRSEYNPIVADDLVSLPYAIGHKFTALPDSDLYRFTVSCEEALLKLYDGRMNHNNGWFVLSSELPTGQTGTVLTWTLTPTVKEDWRYTPVVQVSQVGYHPNQSKKAVLECDKQETMNAEAVVYRFTSEGVVPVLSKKPQIWGRMFRYQYATVDFSEIREDGLYQVCFADSKSAVFRIAENVYNRGVWQPVLEYFLPVQMCHMLVREKYRIWHGHCHKDDATMAPTDYNHFDGYYQGPDTLCKYQPGEHVPGLNAGGWHDAGDYDLRIESQAGEVYNLALAYEEFRVFYDSTTIDQQNHLVEIHQPDGKNDILQQMEHGLLTIVGGYEALGRLYRGIICKDLRQYVLLGDAANMTDGEVSEDDRWVFTEENPWRELGVAAQLAAAYRGMMDHNPELAEKALSIAKELYRITDGEKGLTSKVHAAIELFLSTGEEEYKQYILAHTDCICENFEHIGWIAVRVIDRLQDEVFTEKMRECAFKQNEKYQEACAQNPYGVPYRPGAWGSGWGIQAFGAHYYFYRKAFPDIFTLEPMTNALNFVLGCHPGTNTASFASGVGAKSATIAYGANRANHSYIPGGVISGTELISPDFPELLEFPFLWQQGEYVLGGGSSNYMFLVLAVAETMKKVV